MGEGSVFTRVCHSVHNFYTCLSFCPYPFLSSFLGVLLPELFPDEGGLVGVGGLVRRLSGLRWGVRPLSAEMATAAVGTHPTGMHCYLIHMQLHY